MVKVKKKGEIGGLAVWVKWLRCSDCEAAKTEKKTFFFEIFESFEKKVAAAACAIETVC